MRYALVQSGAVTNVVEWDGDLSRWQPPPGVQAVQSDSAGTGDTWDGTTFTKGPSPLPDPREVNSQRISELALKSPRTATETQELLSLVAKRLAGLG